MIQNGRARRSRAQRSAQLQGGGNGPPLKRSGPQKPVAADPHIQPSTQCAPGASAQRPAAPAFRIVGEKIEPLHAQSQSDRVCGALPDLKTDRRLACPRAGQRGVIEADLMRVSPQGEVELAQGERIGVEERRTGRPSAPCEAGQTGRRGVSGTTLRLAGSIIERAPGAVGGGGPQGGRAGVPELERCPRVSRQDRRAPEDEDRDAPHRVHRSTTARVRDSLLMGSRPSGIVSARTM